MVKSRKHTSSSIFNCPSFLLLPHL